MEWNQDAKDLLEELVKPMPIFVRPMVKKKIVTIILDGAEGESVSKDDVVKGYILASPGDMQE
ncbi:MAG: PCP reductase family protein, partial [Bacillus sp. (in: Bacteria)]|nr:PCP reductase family protein [Bacillus sp. (in: firmicutes)]